MDILILHFAPKNHTFPSPTLLARLKTASRLAVLTGAGVFAESGLATFRGPGGLWKNYRPEDLATPEAFRRDPKIVWERYNWRRDKVRRHVPNPDHHALAQMESRFSPLTFPKNLCIYWRADGAN